MKSLGTILIGILMGCGATVFMERGCHKGNEQHAERVGRKEETGVIADIQKAMADSVTYYRDRYNDEHAKKELVQGDAAAIGLFYKKHEDSLAKVLRIKDNQIQGMYSAQGNVTGSFNAVVDHIGINTPDGPGEVRHFEYSDSLLHEEGWVDSANAYITYSVSVPVFITTYWKRRWLLGRKHYFVDGYSTNPNMHITGLTGVAIK